MGSPNVSKIVRVPGRLIINPTDLNAGPAFGGVEIGCHRDIEFRFNHKVYWPEAEEYGVQVEGIFCGDDIEMHAYARGLDQEAIQYMFPSSSAGASGDRVIFDGDFGGYGVRAGQYLSDLFNLKVLFAPHDVDRHPFVVLYKAIPWINEQAGIPFGMPEEVSYPISFQSIPDGAGRSYSIGRKGSITL